MSFLPEKKGNKRVQTVFAKKGAWQTLGKRKKNFVRE